MEAALGATTAWGRASAMIGALASADIPESALDALRPKTFAGSIVENARTAAASCLGVVGDQLVAYLAVTAPAPCATCPTNVAREQIQGQSD